MQIEYLPIEIRCSINNLAYAWETESEKDRERDRKTASITSWEAEAIISCRK